jgi:DNA-binding YbaB/EbfC family protein
MFGDLGKIMKLAGEMKKKMPEMQAKIAAAAYTAEAGGGAVQATVNGKLQIVDVKIAQAVLADCDAEMLGDLVKAAIAAAQEKATVAAAAMMKEMTGGMNLPGLDGLFS